MLLYTPLARHPSLPGTALVPRCHVRRLPRVNLVAAALTQPRRVSFTEAVQQLLPQYASHNSLCVGYGCAMAAAACGLPMAPALYSKSLLSVAAVALLLVAEKRCQALLQLEPSAPAATVSTVAVVCCVMFWRGIMHAAPGVPLWGLLAGLASSMLALAAQLFHTVHVLTLAAQGRPAVQATSEPATPSSPVQTDALPETSSFPSSTSAAAPGSKSSLDAATLQAVARANVTAAQRAAMHSDSSSIGHPLGLWKSAGVSLLPEQPPQHVQRVTSSSGHVSGHELPSPLSLEIPLRDAWQVDPHSADGWSQPVLNREGGHDAEQGSKHSRFTDSLEHAGEQSQHSSTISSYAAAAAAVATPFSSNAGATLGPKRFGGYRRGAINGLAAAAAAGSVTSPGVGDRLATLVIHPPHMDEHGNIPHVSLGEMLSSSGQDSSGTDSGTDDGLGHNMELHVSEAQLEEAVQHAVEVALAESSIGLQLQANLSTLALVSGVIFYWRGLWTALDATLGSEWWGNLLCCALGLSVVFGIRFFKLPTADDTFREDF